LESCIGGGAADVRMIDGEYRRVHLSIFEKKKIIFHRDSQHGQLAAFALCFPSPAPKVCFREGHAVLKAKFVCRVLLESIRSTAWRHDY